MARKVGTLLGALLILALACSFVWAELPKGRQAGAKATGPRRAGEARRPAGPGLSVPARSALLARFLASLSREQRRTLIAIASPDKRPKLRAFFARHRLRAQVRAGIRPRPAGVPGGRGMAGRPRAAPARKRMPPRPAVQPRKPGPVKKQAAPKPTARPLSPQQLFKRADHNGDGSLSYEEALRAGLLPRPRRGAQPGVEKPAPHEQRMRQMRQRGTPQTQKPAGISLAKRSAPGPASVSDREILENWDILKDLLSLESPKGKE